MATFHSFDQVRLMQKYRLEQVLEAFITETLVTVRARTPIKTGTARAGWQRSSSLIGGPGGLLSIEGLPQVFNDVPYIRRLEYGYSQQAPQGMARITAAESQQRMDAVVARFVT
jgi:hypothetical protein